MIHDAVLPPSRINREGAAVVFLASYGKLITIKSFLKFNGSNANVYALLPLFEEIYDRPMIAAQPLLLLHRLL